MWAWDKLPIPENETNTFINKLNFSTESDITMLSIDLMTLYKDKLKNSETKKAIIEKLKGTSWKEEKQTKVDELIIDIENNFWIKDWISDYKKQQIAIQVSELKNYREELIIEDIKKSFKILLWTTFLKTYRTNSMKELNLMIKQNEKFLLKIWKLYFKDTWYNYENIEHIQIKVNNFIKNYKDEIFINKYNKDFELDNMGFTEKFKKDLQKVIEENIDIK